jgi:SAM-dependent methyltransferase
VATRKRKLKLDETLTACPVCGGADIPNFTFLRMPGVPGFLTYANCLTCGQMFLNPRMSDERTREYYQSDYRNILNSQTGGKEADKLTQRLRASLQAQVLTAWGVVPNKVLDVGCGLGYLLWEWEKRGAIRVGVEPDPDSRTVLPANRYKIYADISELPPEKYDLICMSHSLEHINRPKEYLANMLDKHAHPDTRLMIEVPNTECNGSSYQPHHVMAFTTYTLNNLIQSVGHTIEHKFYHGLSNTTPERYLLVLAKKEGA